ncbi:Sucrase/ferredoxin-like-domain-containing protein [Cladochytrium replicatum]|nr:Sucrase/ferredoxin-like-domain-containing protein [Cladochytrium replicatum]
MFCVGRLPICAVRRIRITANISLPQRTALRTTRAFGNSAKSLSDFVGSVNPHSRHLALCTGREAEWPAQAVAYHPIVSELALQLRMHSAETKLTLIDAPNESTEPDAFDVVVFPDKLKLRSVSVEKIPELIAFLNGKKMKPASAGGLPSPRVIPGERWFLVCIHGAKDARCGEKGQALRDALFAEIATRQMSARVYGTSHIGGHKWAGNVIVLPDGDYYGNLSTEDARALIDKVGAGEVWWDKWRGRMGLDEEQMRELYAKNSGTSSAETPATAASIETIKVSYKTQYNGSREVVAPVGKSLMEVAKSYDISGIEGTCGGFMECASCHVVIDDESFWKRLPPVRDQEEDMLEYAVGRQDRSRLSCQIKASLDLDGIELFVPGGLQLTSGRAEELSEKWNN